MKQRAPKAPDKYRYDYEIQKKKAAESTKQTKEGGQLRSAEQIRKLRIQQEQRKKKNARPSKRKK
jgi:ATP-dependent RNA helicase DDX54/DBP10